MRQLLLTNWHTMRWLRLLFGIAIAIEAVRSSDAMVGIISAFFFFQAFTNTGCGGGTCALPTQNTTSEKLQETKPV